VIGIPVELSTAAPNQYATTADSIQHSTNAVPNQSVSTSETATSSVNSTTGKFVYCFVNFFLAHHNIVLLPGSIGLL